jgi:DNA polymerase-3 subunit chi
MTQVVFFTGVVDRLGFVQRLLRKKYREGARVAVYGPAPVLLRLDNQLWTADPLEFLPHIRVRETTAPAPWLCERTPIWLLDQPRPELGCDTAVNLGWDDVPALLGHTRLAEVIGLGDEERRAGRQRWRAYEAQGCSLQHLPQNA